MSKEKFENNLLQLGMAVEVCLKHTLTTPALVLLYSAIDIVSWLAADDPDASVRQRFTSWVDEYLLATRPLQCTSLELYAARCGLVHTLTPDSRMVEKGIARRIAYAWGAATSSELRESMEQANHSHEVAVVHVEELLEAWRSGLLSLQEELEDDPDRASRVYERAGNFFDNLPLTRNREGPAH